MKTAVCRDVSVAFYNYEIKFSVKIQKKRRRWITLATIMSAIIIAMKLMSTMITIIIKPLIIFLVIINSDNGSK